MHGARDEQKIPKALIIGGGIAGPMTAIFLKQAGIDAEVFEAWPYSTGIGGGLQIAPNGMHVLAEMGLADEMIRARLDRRILRFLFAIRRTASARSTSNMQERVRPARGQHVPRHAERDCWSARPGARMSSLYFEKRLVAIEDRADRPVVAHFADGTTAEGDFIIGADGVHSAVRTPCDPRRPKTVRHRPDRLWRFCRARRCWRTGRSGSASETTFGQSGFFGYGFCSSDPDDGVMWWSTQPSHGIDAAAYRAMSQQEIRQHLKTVSRRLARSDPANPRCCREYRRVRHARRCDVADLVAPAARC